MLSYRESPNQKMEGGTDKMPKKSYYAVFKGKNPGIYHTWEECSKQINGYPDNQYKGFATKNQAKQWLALKKQDAGKSQTFSEKTASKKRPIQKKKNEECCYERLNEEQKAAFQILLGGENVFLTGEAGTGKSFLLKAFLEQAQDKNVLVCAPTGIAALQIGGATIHSVFRIKPKSLFPPNQPVEKVQNTVKAADIIVIDEISMCRFDLFDYLCRYIQKAESRAKKRKQVIVVGDFFQLPPVLPSKERNMLEEVWREHIQGISSGFAFLAPGWESMNFHTIALKKAMRQKEDSQFLEYLNRIRCGDRSAIAWFNQNTAKAEQPGIHMSALNKTVNAINEQKMAGLSAEKRTYQGINENFRNDLPTNQSLALCVGARVMSLLNDARGCYQNGSLGTVEGLKKRSVTVRFDNGYRTEIEPYTWEDVEYQVAMDENTNMATVRPVVTGKYTQLPLKVVFAVTIHKSQGQTYDSVNLDPSCFNVGQLYVALSRVTDVGRLHLTREIENRDLRMSQEVKQFYNSSIPENSM